MKFWRTILALVSMLGAGSELLWPRIARTQQSQRIPTIEEYNPKSTLVTKEHKPDAPSFLSSIFTVITGIPRRSTSTNLSKRWIPSTCACWST